MFEPFGTKLLRLPQGRHAFDLGFGVPKTLKISRIILFFDRFFTWNENPQLHHLVPKPEKNVHQRRRRRQGQHDVASLAASGDDAFAPLEMQEKWWIFSYIFHVFFQLIALRALKQLWRSIGRIWHVDKWFWYIYVILHTSYYIYIYCNIHYL